MPLNGFATRNEVIWALVPVKPLAQAKRRLKSCLGIDRRVLSTAMLRDLLQGLAKSREVTRTAIVTSDEEIKDLGTAFDAYLIDEAGGRGLNLALELGRATIRDLGIERIAVCPADLPLATDGEIDRLIRMRRGGFDQRRGEVVGICPSRDRRGTNFLCLDTCLELPFAFGPESFERHRELAAERSATVVTLHSDTLSLDIDRPADLEELIARCESNARFRATETWRYLASVDSIEGIEVIEDRGTLPQ